MTVIPVSALECSITELCRILADSFNESLTPFALPPEMFASRFISEGLSLEDSFVWLVNDNPAAIAIVTRRMDKARLAAFGVLPEYRSQGLAKQMLTPLFTSLKEKKLSSVRLEVMRENTGQSLSITRSVFRFADICANTGEIHSLVRKYLQEIWNPRLLMTSCVPSGLHQMMIFPGWPAPCSSCLFPATSSGITNMHGVLSRSSWDNLSSAVCLWNRCIVTRDGLKECFRKSMPDGLA